MGRRAAVFDPIFVAYIKVLYYEINKFITLTGIACEAENTRMYKHENGPSGEQSHLHGVA